MNNKKAQMRKSLVGIIVVIITAAIILISIGPLSGVFKETMDKETCRASVNARSAIIEKGIIAESVVRLPKLKCKTEYICLSIDGNCDKNYDKIKVENNLGIKKEIAGMMYECWEMLGKGEKSFMGSWENGIMQNEHSCVICSVIDFDSEIKSQEKIEGFGEYMYKTKVPGKNFTYLEFISNTKGIEFISGNEDILSTKQKQSIIFSVGKSSNIKNWVAGMGTGAATGGVIGTIIPGAGTLIGSGIGMVIGGLAGISYQSEYVTSLLLVPYESEEITKYCRDLKSAV